MPFATNARDQSEVYFEDDGGGGVPLVILGGFLDPVELVRRAPIAVALRDLADEFRLIFIDHRGHGRSAKPHDVQAYAMPLRVADVLAVLDALDIERAHFVGISWGGRLCFGIGELASERVLSLVIMGQQPYAMNPDGPLARVVMTALADADEGAMEALVASFEAIAGRYPEAVRAIYLACDPAALRAASTAAISEGAVSEDLRAWDVPCLICVAAQDVDFFEQARRAADEIPQAEFVSIQDEDHLGLDTASIDPVLRVALPMLRSSAPGR
jgi:pimeloyl-ACP methyl ester carboxylesterase